MLLLQSRFCGPQESQVEKNKQCLGEEDKRSLRKGVKRKGQRKGKGKGIFVFSLVRQGGNFQIMVD